jgi:hypothetical protein
LPDLKPLAASPVAATATTHTTTLPLVVCAIVLATLAGVLHTRVVRHRPGRRKDS